MMLSFLPFVILLENCWVLEVSTIKMILRSGLIILSSPDRIDVAALVLRLLQRLSIFIMKNGSFCLFIFAFAHSGGVGDHDFLVFLRHL